MLLLLCHVIVVAKLKNCCVPGSAQQLILSNIKTLIKDRLMQFIEYKQKKKKKKII